LNRFLKYLTWAVVLSVCFLVWQASSRHQVAVRNLDISQLVSRADRGDVRTVQIGKQQLEGEFRDGTRYRVWLPAGERDPWITKLSANPKVNIGYDQPGPNEVWISSLITFAMVALFLVGFWVLIMRQAQSGSGQALSFGRSRAKRLTEGMPRVTFSDVAGVDEAKAELVEVVDFLKNAKRFQALGARIPRGVLLLGPPGCGKTLLARAVAGEAGVPFFHISGSDFVEMFVGVGASRVRDLFEQAKANRPCIVFIDEIDAVGRQRFAGVGGGHDEREQTLNQLLVEMDGFDPNSGVILVAATNRPDVLDPALLRPGRFDRRIMVDNPDLRGREAILAVHAKGKPLAEDVDLSVLARRTPGFSGADLANMMNEAALLAARRGKTKIEMEDCEDSIDRVVAGPERKSRIISDQEKAILAYHEVGHAVLAEVLPHADPMHKTSILPRGMALGYTLQLPLEDKYITTRSELFDDITVLMAGRVAEQLYTGEITTGATNDIERATELARRMITEFGMSDELGPRSLGHKHGMTFLGRDLMEERNYSDEIAQSIDSEIRNILDQCYAHAKEILEQRREQMKRIVAVLLEKETLEREEFLALLGEPGKPMHGEDTPSGEPAPGLEQQPERPAEDGRIGGAPEPQPA